jgi:hypothetical protein
MLAVESIVARLTTQGVFKTVHGALELAAAIERKQFAAEAYVMLTAASPDKNELINAVSQRLAEEYSILFWARAINDPTGAAALNAIGTTRDAIVAALLGWQPDSARAPLTYAGGSLGQFVGGGILWEEQFVTDSYMRST